MDHNQCIWKGYFYTVYPLSPKVIFTDGQMTPNSVTDARSVSENKKPGH